MFRTYRLFRNIEPLYGRSLRKIVRLSSSQCKSPNVISFDSYKQIIINELDIIKTSYENIRKNQCDTAMLGTTMIASQTVFDSIMPFDNILSYLMHVGTMSIYIYSLVKYSCFIPSASLETIIKMIDDSRSKEQFIEFNKVLKDYVEKKIIFESINPVNDPEKILNILDEADVTVRSLSPIENIKNHFIHSGLQISNLLTMLFFIDSHYGFYNQPYIYPMSVWAVCSIGLSMGFYQHMKNKRNVVIKCLDDFIHEIKMFSQKKIDLIIIKSIINTLLYPMAIEKT